MADRLAAPGMGAYINAYRAVIGTNSTLHAARGVWYHLSRREDCMLIRIAFENSKNRHIKIVEQVEKKLRA